MDQIVRGTTTATVLLVQQAGPRADEVASAFGLAGLGVRGPVDSVDAVEDALADGDVGHAVIDVAVGEPLAGRIVALLARRGVTWLLLAAHGSAGADGSRRNAAPVAGVAQASS